jgi:hypothetical protein
MAGGAGLLVCHLRLESSIAAQTGTDGIWPAIPIQSKYSSCMNPMPHPEAAQLVSRSGISFVEEAMAPNTRSYCA